MSLRKSFAAEEEYLAIARDITSGLASDGHDSASDVLDSQESLSADHLTSFATVLVNLCVGAPKSEKIDRKIFSLDELVTLHTEVSRPIVEKLAFVDQSVLSPVVANALKHTWSQTPGPPLGTFRRAGSSAAIKEQSRQFVDLTRRIASGSFKEDTSSYRDFDWPERWSLAVTFSAACVVNDGALRTYGLRELSALISTDADIPTSATESLVLLLDVSDQPTNRELAVSILALARAQNKLA